MKAWLVAVLVVGTLAIAGCTAEAPGTTPRTKSVIVSATPVVTAPVSYTLVIAKRAPAGPQPRTTVGGTLGISARGCVTLDGRAVVGLGGSGVSTDGKIVRLAGYGDFPVGGYFESTAVKIDAGSPEVARSAVSRCATKQFVFAGYGPPPGALYAGRFTLLTHKPSPLTLQAAGIGTLSVNAAGCLTLKGDPLLVPAGSTLHSDGSVAINGKRYKLGDTLHVGGGQIPAPKHSPCGQVDHYHVV